jgi:Icc-related predicted phosphoesterase
MMDLFIRIVAISDTHGKHRQITVPDGDILIHAGDLTARGSLADLSQFNAFLGELPHRNKIVIAGNHDWCLQRQPQEARAVLTNCHYLEDETAIIDGIRFYGSPWQPWFLDWAFNLRRGDEIRAKWELIPEGTDVLVTHGPPLGYGDRTVRGDQVGCEDLLAAVLRVRPQMHIFGHIHEGAGLWHTPSTVFVNASSCDSDYGLVNRPIVYDYHEGLVTAQ